MTEAHQVGGAAVEAAVRGETKMSAIKRLSDQPYRIETKRWSMSPGRQL